jgi:hypothetical protein
MLKALLKTTFSLSLLSAVGLSSLIGANPASAFSFNSDGSIGVGLTDIGKSFQVSFDGNVATQNVSDLTSLATFTFQGFENIGSFTQAKFDIDLKNTSTGAIASRTSVLGFDTDLALQNASVATGGLFSNAILNGSLPNQFGALDVCFTDGNNCQGGQNGGAASGQNSQTFSAKLAFNQGVSQFALSNFGVRYQSISGTNLGTSGTGKGTVKPPRDPNKIPEPGMAIAIALTSLGVLSASRKSKQSETEQQVAV